MTLTFKYLLDITQSWKNWRVLDVFSSSLSIIRKSWNWDRTRTVFRFQGWVSYKIWSIIFMNCELQFPSQVSSGSILRSDCYRRCLCSSSYIITWNYCLHQWVIFHKISALIFRKFKQHQFSQQDENQCQQFSRTTLCWQNKSFSWYLMLLWINRYG